MVVGGGEGDVMMIFRGRPLLRDISAGSVNVRTISGPRMTIASKGGH
jgi:hypothetical protein